MKHTPRGRRRAWSAGAALVTVALVAAACGSSSSSSSSGGSSGGSSSSAFGGSSTTGVTADSITIGTTTPLTGPAAPGYSEIAPAANAYFQYVNAQGGVDGRKIKYLIKDDGYDPSQTATLTRELVLQDQIFADVGPLGTPTVLNVQDFLNSEKVPAVFVETGCNCWSDPNLPGFFGWQPPYTDEGKILGQYVAKNFAGQKVGYLSQDDEFGQDGVKGLDDQITKSDVVSRQTYTGTAAGLANGLGSQMSALKAAGAQVVVLYTIPAATALALLGAAQIGYSPTFVVSSVGADPSTLTGLLTSFSKGAAGAALLNGMITNTYLPVLTDTTNPWIAGFKNILNTYDKGAPLDGNTEYGLSLGYTFVQALKAAGKNLTRGALVKALEDQGSSFQGPGLVPLTYSGSVHYGYQGSEVVKYSNGGQTITPVTGRLVTTLNGPITTTSAALATPPSNFGS